MKSGYLIRACCKRALRFFGIMVIATHHSGVASEITLPVVATKFYRIETVPVPSHVVPEVGGMTFMQDGRLMVCTRRGEIWSLKNGSWKRFAEGLDEPMGICPTGPDEIVISQRPELTRLTDTDCDGVADQFETLTDAWRYSGHIYEWTFGPVRDSEGNFFGTLACWFYPRARYGRSPYSGWEIPPPQESMQGTGPQWRGWSFKITRSGAFIPWSSGLRSPNGLGFNSSGDLFVTDNQGEYFGACVLHHISRGAFHGHPNSLFWGPDAVEDPFSIPLEELEARRKPPAIVFPYGVMGQSASEPICDTSGGKFGPFAGQLFVGDQTKSAVMRVALEKVAGEYQGACFPFLSGFVSGVNRLVFGPDGSLYAGQTDRGWGAIGGKRYGLEKIVWSGVSPFAMHSMRLTQAGFEIRFTEPVDRERASDQGTWSLQRFRYHYHRKYGSPRVDEQPVAVREITVSEDGKSVSLAIADLLPGTVYELHAQDLRSADGGALLNDAAYYTLNRLQP